MSLQWLQEGITLKENTQSFNHNIYKKTPKSRLVQVVFRRRATAARIARTRTGSSIEASVGRGGSRERQKRAKKVKRKKEKIEELKELRDALISWRSSRWKKKWTEEMLQQLCASLFSIEN